MESLVASPDQILQPLDVSGLMHPKSWGHDIWNAGLGPTPIVASTLNIATDNLDHRLS